MMQHSDAVVQNDVTCDLQTPTVHGECNKTLNCDMCVNYVLFIFQSEEFEFALDGK